VLADGGVVAGQILERVRDRDLSMGAGYPAEVQDLRRRIRSELGRQWPSETRAMEAIRSVLPRETITTWDTTVPASRASRAFRAYEPGTFINPYGWVSIGFSFPAAVGAKVANPDKPVVCFSGDGGFQYCMAELATSVQYGLNLTVVLFNDGAWGVLKWMQKARYGGRHLGTDLVNPDFVKVAESYGIAGVRVDTLEELLPVLEEAAGSDRTTLIEVRIPRGFSEFA
jgi:acetolactate synthase-1/2/3 large subunit